MSNLEKAITEYEKAKARHDRLVARYNREYREGRWSTNRPLASKCENAYDDMIRAAIAATEVEV